MKLDACIRLILTAFVSALFLTSCGTLSSVREEDKDEVLRNSVLAVAQSCLPRPGMSRAELSVFWPPSLDGNFGPWRGKGREGQYHEINLEGTDSPGGVRVTLLVWYQDGKVESAEIRLPDMINAEVLVDSHSVKLPLKKSDADVLKDTLVWLNRLSEELNSEGWQLPNNAPEATR